MEKPADIHREEKKVIHIEKTGKTGENTVIPIFIHIVHMENCGDYFIVCDGKRTGVLVRSDKTAKISADTER